MNNKIEIFQAEKKAGLEAQIRANASIAYHAPVLLGNDLESPAESKPLTWIANAAKDDPDIHHVYSILVTTSWNKNDDVFAKEEVWASKNTPKYKPTNLEHDEKQIVGGMIDNWAVDQDFKLIDENIDPTDLPDHYHILVASVIYKQWQDPTYQKRASDLIKQIEAGNKHVSMECVFKGFDYAVLAPNGKNHILTRNNETAFLTQHLRSYGGTGRYQDHQVGRLLRHITFSGKGFVDRPANPESIIFDQNRVFEFNKASISSKNMFLNENGVIMKIDNLNCSDTQESYDMSNEILNDQIAELKTALESARADNKELTSQLSEASVEKHKEAIEKLAAALQAQEEHVKALKAELETTHTESAELSSKFELVSEAYEKLEVKMTDMETAERLRHRKESLLQAGLSDEEADAKMETFGGLSDDQFAALADTLAAYHTTLDTPETATDDYAEEEAEAASSSEDDSDAAQATEEKVDEEVLETVQAEEVMTMSLEADASVGGNDEAESVRASLKDWVQTVILDNNNSESGE